MTRRSFTNQEVQIGKEGSHGGGTSAGHILGGMSTWTLGAKPTTKQFPTAGRHNPAASALLTDESSGKVSGVFDSATVAYILGSHFGDGGPLAHSPSVTAFDYTWTPALTGKYIDTALSYIIQCGDAADAEQYVFCVFNGFSYSFGRTQELTIASDFLAQAFTDGITKTTTPTYLVPIPMTGAMANVYLDPTSAGLGTTQLTTAVLNYAFKADPYYKQYWPINRANASFADLTDMAKKHVLTLKLEADSTSIAYKATYLATGARCYVRCDVQGPLIDVANSIHASFRHDMACFVTGMKEFADVDGVYAVEYELTVAEDTAWSSGTSQILTATSLLAAIA
jgi:hypothetical protein